MLHLGLLGAPLDAGASKRGSSLGPNAIRGAHLYQRLAQNGHIVHDYGNIPVDLRALDDLLSPQELRQSVLNTTAQISEATKTILERREVPIVLGGDQSISLGVLSAVARFCVENLRPLLVVWIDSAMDAETAADAPMNKTILGSLKGINTALGQPEISAAPPLLNIPIIQLGIREAASLNTINLSPASLDVWTTQQIIHWGSTATLERLLARIPDGTHVHVTIDMSGVDPVFAPGVNTLTPQGIGPGLILDIFRGLGETGCVHSLDISEINPLEDHEGITAGTAVDLIAALLGETPAPIPPITPF